MFSQCRNNFLIPNGGEYSDREISKYSFYESVIQFSNSSMNLVMWTCCLWNAINSINVHQRPLHALPIREWAHKSKASKCEPAQKRKIVYAIVLMSLSGIRLALATIMHAIHDRSANIWRYSVCLRTLEYSRLFIIGR